MVQVLAAITFLLLIAVCRPKLQPKGKILKKLPSHLNRCQPGSIQKYGRPSKWLLRLTKALD